MYPDWIAYIWRLCLCSSVVILFHNEKDPTSFRFLVIIASCFLFGYCILVYFVLIGSMSLIYVVMRYVFVLICICKVCLLETLVSYLL